MSRQLLLIGGTGLIGRLLADRLLARGDEVHALLRRSAGRHSSRWKEHVSPPEHWPQLARTHSADVAISALGTTWRAAGSEAAFRAVDFGMVVDFAAAAREAGVRQMIAVSSVGADPNARAFYLRVKGEMEAALRALGFARLDIIRPGLLRGERGPERRLGERAGILVSPLTNLFLRGRLDRFAAIDAAIVADSIARLVGQEAPGTFMHHNRNLRRLAHG